MNAEKKADNLVAKATETKKEKATKTDKKTKATKEASADKKDNKNTDDNAKTANLTQQVQRRGRSRKSYTPSHHYESQQNSTDANNNRRSINVDWGSDVVSTTGAETRNVNVDLDF